VRPAPVTSDRAQGSTIAPSNRSQLQVNPNRTNPAGETIDGPEGKARRALEGSAGRVFSDDEWSRIKKSLVDLCAILSDWERQARGDGSREER